MPFIQRIVEPTHVSRVEVGQGIHNELECVTNHSLANIIRQLSTLSKHAEDMFSELYQETTDFFRRASQLNSRVEHLRVTVTQLNPTEEIGKGHNSCRILKSIRVNCRLHLARWQIFHELCCRHFFQN